MSTPTSSPHYRRSDTASESSVPGSASAEATRHLHDTLRVLRCLEKVEISGTSHNWDAKKCFVLLVYVRDTDARKSAYARGEMRKSPAPFQIERTPHELKKLLSAMRQWCVKPHAFGEKPCAFCTPVANNALVGEALRWAAGQDAGSDAYDPMDDNDQRAYSSCCFGFLSTSFGMGADALKPETDGEWEAWLNVMIAHIRVNGDLQADAADTCDGARHAPALLARFLLDGFLTDAIPIVD
jgi:hypothetical protein